MCLRCLWPTMQSVIMTGTYLVCAVVNVYVPNAGEGLKRLEYRLSAWDTSFSEHLAKLGERKPVILAGDLNCAPQPIDIHNPKRSVSCERVLGAASRSSVKTDRTARRL